MTIPPTDPPLRLTLISASIRDQRMTPALIPWLLRNLSMRPEIELDLIDLAEIQLPDERQLAPGQGAGGPLGERVAAADAYIFLVPEYNHSYPAPLKRFIDAFYTEWAFTAATVVSYGARGGLLAIEHLRGVLAELRMVVTRRVVGLTAPWTMLDHDGLLRDDKDVNVALRLALDELVWWADVLREARTTRGVPL